MSDQRALLDLCTDRPGCPSPMHVSTCPERLPLAHMGRDVGADRLTHFVRGGPAAIRPALEHGSPVTAACGKRWVPARDPNRFPVCQDCLVALFDGDDWWAA